MSKVIDFHVHTFPDRIAAATVMKLAAVANIRAYTNGTKEDLKRSMERSGVSCSLVYPVVTNPASTIKINDSAIITNEEAETTGIYSFGGIHPDSSDVRQELKRIKRAGIKGIKLHPDYQNTFFDDIRYLRIMDLAVEEGLKISVHAGIDVGMAQTVHCTPDRVLQVLKSIPGDSIILAHMGGWKLWDEVEFKLAGSSVFLDTAVSVGKMEVLPGQKIIPKDGSMMGEEEFKRFIQLFGEDKILFATDSPWGDQAVMIHTIKQMNLPEHTMDRIFYQNAATILEL